MAATLAASGDFPAYTNICQRMLECFSASTNAKVLEFAANASLLLPASEAQTATAARLAEAAAGTDNQSGAAEWFLFARGLAEYRRGHFPRVVELAQKARDHFARAENDSAAAAADVETEAVLAMALKRLGREPRLRPPLERRSAGRSGTS